MKRKFSIYETASCKKVFIPKEYCTIYLQGASIDDIEVSQVGADVCIENLSSNLQCQKINKELEAGQR